MPCPDRSVLGSSALNIEPLLQRAQQAARQLRNTSTAQRNHALTCIAEAIESDLAGDTVATPGGGTLPGVEIPSAGLVVPGDHVVALRTGDPPIIARVVEGSTVVDLRTVHPDDDPLVAEAIDRLG